MGHRSLRSHITTLRSHITTPSELVGYIAIILGGIGGFTQLLKTHETQMASSFSPIYLVSALAAEILFAAQGGMMRSPTIVLTRIGAFVYFAYLLLVWLRGRPHPSAGNGSSSPAPPTPPTHKTTTDTTDATAHAASGVVVTNMLEPRPSLDRCGRGPAGRDA